MAGHWTLGVWTIKCSVMSWFTLVCGCFVSKLVDRGVDISDQDLARDVVSKVQHLDGDLDHVNNTWIKISTWRSSCLSSSLLLLVNQRELCLTCYRLFPQVLSRREILRMKSAKKLVKRQICGKNCDQTDCEQKNSERRSRDRFIDI